jgi:Animal haem peroxidase
MAIAMMMLVMTNFSTSLLLPGINAMPLNLDWIRSIDNVDTRADSKGAVGGDNLFRRLSQKAYEVDPANGSTTTTKDLFTTRPNARDISNIVFRQDGEVGNMLFLTNIVWQWGQFIDHDFALTGHGDEYGTANIAVDDNVMNSSTCPSGHIEMSRTAYVDVDTTGTNDRDHENFITSFLDGSVVYGSTQERADLLRANDGTGKLKVMRFDGWMLYEWMFGLMLLALVVHRGGGCWTLVA